LRLLEQECFGVDAWPLLDLISVLTVPGIVRLKAAVNGKMVGFIGGDPRPAEKVGWITTLGVLEHFRRKGIASALLEVCEHKLNQPFLKLCVRRTNTGAIALYFRHGYHAIDIWPRYYSSGEDALVLEKEYTESAR
jgi:ribosomal-protein-alanine N-acetyltransferase